MILVWLTLWSQCEFDEFRRYRKGNIVFLYCKVAQMCISKQLLLTISFRDLSTSCYGLISFCWPMFSFVHEREKFLSLNKEWLWKYPTGILHMRAIQCYKGRWKILWYRCFNKQNSWFIVTLKTKAHMLYIISTGKN